MAVARSRRTSWMCSLADVARKALRRTDNRIAKQRISRDEARGAVKKPKHVVTNQHLTVATRPGTDADRGDGQPRGHFLGNGVWNRLQDDRESSGVLERQGVLHEFLGSVAVARLSAHSAQSMHMLRGQP